MREFLDKCCISQENLTGLRVIHVAGTKGKGSTCAYLERLCRSVGLKTGLFCSPHLISSRERIKINGIPLTKEQFSHTFSKVWQPFSQSEARPGYFRMLTLMAFEAFIGSQVDVAIFEVGIGGRFDPTNVVERPAVTAITSLALEHTDMLGNSIQTIAWHKSGIIKVILTPQSRAP